MDKRIGIYLFRNKINDKVYIGQSVDINERIKQHKYRGSVFHKSIIKYGWENFEYEILEECNINDLDEKESYYIDFYNSTTPEFGYNILKHAKENPTKGKSRTDELKCQLSDIMKNKYENGYENPFYGKSHSSYSKKIMSDKKKESYIGEKNPFYGKSHSDEAKKKMSHYASNRDMSHWFKKVIQLDKQTNEIIKIWNSLSDASEYLTGNRRNSTLISKCCNGKYKSSMGFKWRYLD